MARIDWTGTIKYQVDTEPNDFDFTELPDDDDELDDEPTEEEYDAYNAETFGHFSSNEASADLEIYSKQTAICDLDDSSSICLVQPSCSEFAPAPSEIPQPPLSLLKKLAINSESKFVRSDENFRVQLGTNDALWKNIDAKSSWNVKSEITKNAHDFINNDQTNGVAIITDELQLAKQPIENNAAPALAAMPQNALTLEEIEKGHLESNANKLPPIPFEGFLTLADVEKCILMDSSYCNSTLQNNTHLISRLPPSKVNPPMRPMPPCVPMPPLISLQNIRGPIMRPQAADVPPGFPRIEPQLKSAFINVPPHPSQIPFMMRVPFGFMVPPSMRNKPPLIPYSFSQHSRYFGPSSQNRGCNRDRLGKRAGMPSNKTIADFALNPFAGFVSKKEREWLIKIQLLQCEGSGNSHEEDFYYTIWKQRRMADKNHENVSKVNKGKSNDHPASASNSHHYILPKFVGSLGRPTLSNVNYPRQLIDLHGESIDDDDKMSLKTSNSQKKLRALFLQIENIAVLIIECEDKEREMELQSATDSSRSELQEQINDRLAAIVDSFYENNRIKSLMIIKKGRQMFTRALALGFENHKLQLLKAFLNVLPSVEKKVAANELNISLTASVYKALSSISKNVLSDLIENIKLPSDFSFIKSCFLVNILMMLVYCCAKTQCRSVTRLISSFLPSKVPDSAVVKIDLNEFITLAMTHVRLIHIWCVNNIIGYKGSLMEELVKMLASNCSSRCRSITSNSATSE